MVLDSKFKSLEEHFGIQRPEDWCHISADQVTDVWHIGEATLNQLRLTLANHGLTLKNDGTPAGWQAHFDVIHGPSRIAPSQRQVVTSYTVLIDNQEKNPFTFQGLRTDAKQGHKPQIVQTKSVSLGPSHGDYSLEGYERYVHIERKSLEDIQDTILGFSERRERFEATLNFLAEIPYAAVVIESGFDESIATIKARGSRSEEALKKTFHRSVLAYCEDYRVPFYFCGNRRLAEITTLRLLERARRKHLAERKRAEMAAREFEDSGL